jgi:hypothetical protein
MHFKSIGVCNGNGLLFCELENLFLRRCLNKSSLIIICGSFGIQLNEFKLRSGKKIP